MKINLKLSRRKRIILLYVIGLILPGIILGFFAFRGLRNDQALREKQNQQEIKLLSIDIFSELDMRVDLIKSELLSHPYQEHPYCLISWQKPDQENPQIIQGRMVYYPDGSSSTESSLPIPEQINEIQLIEFSKEDYPSAISLYQLLLNEQNNDPVKVQALLGLGRIYKKTGQFDEAITTYQTLIENHPEDMLFDNLPVKALSLLEQIALFKQTSNSVASKKASDELVSFLISPTLRIEQSSYEYLLDRWEALGGEASDDDRAKLLKAKNLTSYLHRLNEMITGLMRDQLSHHNLASDEYPGIFIQARDSSSSQFAWVLSMDSIVNHEFEQIFGKIDQEKQYSWEIIRDNANQSITDEESGTRLEVNFPSGYPTWKLLISKAEISGWQRLFKTSQGVLLLVFVFIFLLMIAGLVFMLYTLSQEMKLNKMKSQFISNVSHEFKTPLTSIRHMTEIMHLKRIDSEERKEEYLQTMLEQCDHLGHLIENILDFSKIEEDIKNYRFESHQLDEIMQDLIPVFKGRIGDEQYELNLEIKDVPPQMLLDKDAVQQVLFNLLDNAYKYSQNSKRIDIILSSQSSEHRAQEGQKEILVSVRDFGIGISEKDLGRIFERFYRGDRLRTEGIKGSGIGLTIVNRIVKAHGGRIEVKSQIDKGTTFTIYLPVNEEV